MIQETILSKTNRELSEALEIAELRIEKLETECIKLREELETRKRIRRANQARPVSRRCSMAHNFDGLSRYLTECGESTMVQVTQDLKWTPARFSRVVRKFHDKLIKRKDPRDYTVGGLRYLYRLIGQEPRDFANELETEVKSGMADVTAYLNKYLAGSQRQICATTGLGPTQFLRIIKKMGNKIVISKAIQDQRITIYSLKC